MCVQMYYNATRIIIILLVFLVYVWYYSYDYYRGRRSICDCSVAHVGINQQQKWYLDRSKAQEEFVLVLGVECIDDEEASSSIAIRRCIGHYYFINNVNNISSSIVRS